LGRVLSNVDRPWEKGYNYTSLFPQFRILWGWRKVANLKRIMVSVPVNLLHEVDRMIDWEEGGNRSKFIREALKRYVEDQRKLSLREKLKQGYLEMAALNLQLAEEGLEVDEATS
jgi:CopG family transcriptional regulator/antitoxin EndoAI